MKTFETNKAVVDIIAWPENRKWEGRYQTISVIEKGIFRLTLSSGVFYDSAKANSAYKRFAKRISQMGYNPPNIVFKDMKSPVTKNVFCIMTTKESVFNSSCEIKKTYEIEAGKGESRRVCVLIYEEDQKERKMAVDYI